MTWGWTQKKGWQIEDRVKAAVGMGRGDEAGPLLEAQSPPPRALKIPAPMNREASWLEGGTVINILAYTLTPCLAESTLVNLGLPLKIDSFSY